MDLFEEYLKKENSSIWVKRALTDSSYKRKYEEDNNKKYQGQTNKDLATYGDAVIKLCILELKLDQTDNLTIDKSFIESDENLVRVIAKHYNMLEYIHTDTKNKNIKRDYNFIKPNKTSGNYRKASPHKYIATAVEAMIGAIYKEEGKLDKIIELMDSWCKMSGD